MTSPDLQAAQERIRIKTENNNQIAHELRWWDLILKDFPQLQKQFTRFRTLLQDGTAEDALIEHHIGKANQNWRERVEITPNQTKLLTEFVSFLKECGVKLHITKQDDRNDDYCEDISCPVRDLVNQYLESIGYKAV